MVDNKTHILIDLISEIISQEFINASMCGVCLPANILLWTLLKKLKINSKLECGKLQYTKNQIFIEIPVHMWNEFDGRVIDPTRKITEFYMGELVSGEYSYLPNQQVAINLEDMLLIYTYIQCSIGNSADFYWSKAPDYLQRIKTRVESRVNTIIQSKNVYMK